MLLSCLIYGIIIAVVSGYVGVQRFKNGTDIELYSIEHCSRFLGRQKVIYPNHCGFVCSTKAVTRSSVYNKNEALTGCEWDYEILEKETKGEYS